MDIRIGVSGEGSKRVIHVEGRLSAEGVADLEKVAREMGLSPTLDLLGLRLVDKAGIDALCRLKEAGAILKGASPYIELLLKDATRQREKQSGG